MKVLRYNYCSILESRLFKAKLTDLIKDADIIVNPNQYSLIGKLLVINLDVPINKNLQKYNKIISRFPLKSDFNYELVPYDLPKYTIDVPKKRYSNLILNKYMLMDKTDKYDIDSNSFILGLDTDIDGYINAVGYKILENKII